MIEEQRQRWLVDAGGRSAGTPSCAASDMAYAHDWRQLLDASPAAVLMVDEQGRITFVNQRVQEWFGYAVDELLGQQVELLVPERVRDQHVRMRQHYWQQPVVRPMGRERDLWARRKDGSEFACDVSLHPLQVQGKWQVMVHLVDVTERRQLEAERQQQVLWRRFQALVEHLPAGAVYRDGDRLLVNRAVETLTGYPRDHLNTIQAWFDRLFADRAQAERAHYEQQRAAHFPTLWTYQLLRRDGLPRWIEQVSYRDERHEIWLLHDVTEQRQEQQRLLQAERLAAIGQMMTALAHESRNALQRAQACLEMMTWDLEGHGELLALAERAQTALAELQRLYEEVRGYAAPVTLQSSWVELWPLVQEVWESVNMRDGTCGAELNLADPSPPLVWGDRHRLGQVFRNILENACAAVPAEGGCVWLTWQEEADGDRTWLVVSIRDNGPGLTPEQRSRIFEPFYTTKVKGTGLGMPIALRLMQAHRGEIQVGNPPSGAEIRLRFPLDVARQPAQTMQVAQHPTARAPLEPRTLQTGELPREGS